MFFNLAHGSAWFVIHNNITQLWIQLNAMKLFTHVFITNRIS